MVRYWTGGSQDSAAPNTGKTGTGSFIVKVSHIALYDTLPRELYFVQNKTKSTGTFILSKCVSISCEMHGKVYIIIKSRNPEY